MEVVALLERELSVGIVMEYYPDGNIADVQLDEASYISAAGQLLDGLQHLHSNGLTHRDLKPANILIRLHRFKVVIADFGLSKIATNSDSLKTFCGTLEFAAPEVFERNGYGTNADMWSWGVMTYYWIYSRPEIPKLPANGRDMRIWSSRWSKRLRTALEDQEGCSLITLLRHTIEEDPAKRWTAQRCLKAGFDNPPLFKHRDSDNVVVCVDAMGDDALARKPTYPNVERSKLSSSNVPASGETTILLSNSSTSHAGEVTKEAKSSTTVSAEHAQPNI